MAYTGSSNDGIWWDYDLTRPMEYNRCIKQLVKMCRTSIEYNTWQKRTKWRLPDNCPICGIDYTIAKPETHHYPKTLYEVVEEFLQNYLQDNSLNEISPLELVNEIMQAHIHDEISYVVVCEHCHAKYHNQDPETMEAMKNILEEVSQNVKNEQD